MIVTHVRRLSVSSVGLNRMSNPSRKRSRFTQNISEAGLLKKAALEPGTAAARQQSKYFKANSSKVGEEGLTSHPVGEDDRRQVSATDQYKSKRNSRRIMLSHDKEACDRITLDSTEGHLNTANISLNISEPAAKKKPGLDAAAEQTETGNSCHDNRKTGPGRLPASFYDQPCEDLAKALLGQVLVRVLDNGEILKGKIVETEAYLGGEDKASHSCDGKRTDRNKAMYMEPGTVYVYHIYGMYTCMNISSRGDGAAVLLRAIEPLSGKVTMRKQRSAKRSQNSKPLKDKDVGSGPSKLTQALHIDKASANQKSLTNCDYLWVEPGDMVPTNQIQSCARIGVEYAGEWAKKPLRYYVIGNEHVSVINKSTFPGGQDRCQTSASSRLPYSFYNRETVTVARALLGQVLVRITETGQRLSGRIVEAEAYLGTRDPACHCYGGKRTARTEAMFMRPGTAYVYHLYYTSCCFNISTRDEGAVVLIRALEPLDGADIMRTNRGTKMKNVNSLKDNKLCNGPSKLCTALAISKQGVDKTDLTSSATVWLEEEASLPDCDVVTSYRIGLEKYPEELHKPYRFYVRGSSSVSVRDREAE